jgi:hypothetical protein
MHRFILFNSQKPEDKGNHDQQIEQHVVPALFFFDEVPNQDGQDISADQIINNHNKHSRPPLNAPAHEKA